MNMTFVSNGVVATKRIRLPWRRSLICSLLLLVAEASAQLPIPSTSADELVRRTVAHELAAANAGGHFQYRFEEQTTRGSETHDVLESRGWSLERLILKNGRPLTAAEK